ncbi:energy-coupling factor ABC transporter permease [Candidatus Latescibacterota bacterium]
MHIPPGFLKPQIWMPMSVISASGIGYALRQTNRLIDDRKVPLMGVMAAFIFAAQMINFPVVAGTSGHLVGATLATVILGVWPAMVVMTAVLIVQALLFQDGGLDALGANVFNMCIWGCLISGAVMATTRRFGPRCFYPSVAVAGWLSVFGAAIFCGLELAASGTSPFLIVVPAMAGIHAIIGVFEGIISIIALRFIRSLIRETGIHSVGDGR